MFGNKHEKPADWDEVQQVPLTPETAALIEGQVGLISCYIGLKHVERRMQEKLRPDVEYSYRKALGILGPAADLELLSTVASEIQLNDL